QISARIQPGEPKSPGSTALPLAWSTSAASPASPAPIAAIRVSEMPISAATLPTPGMTSVPPRTTRSKRELTRAFNSLAGPEPLRFQLGEEALTLEVAQVPVDLGQQFLVLEPRVDADDAGIPNCGVSESAVDRKSVV